MHETPEVVGSDDVSYGYYTLHSIQKITAFSNTVRFDFFIHRIDHVGMTAFSDQMFVSADRNGDGKVSLEEFRESD
jgi:hypothetical protein